MKSISKISYILLLNFLLVRKSIHLYNLQFSLACKIPLIIGLIVSNPDNKF